jgi:excisionase family DNA binding protein
VTYPDPAPGRGGDDDRVARFAKNTKFMTPQEVADHLRVSKMTVYRLLKSGEMPSVRIGRSLRVRESDLHAFLRARFNETG